MPQFRTSMATSGLDVGDKSPRMQNRPKDVNASMNKHGKRKSSIPKNVRLDLEKALLEVCEVWFKEIKPYLLQNNIKIHSNSCMERGKGDEHKPCVSFHPDSRLWPGSKVPPERHCVSKSSQTPQMAVLQQATRRTRQSKSVQTHSIQHQQKSPEITQPHCEPKMRRRRRRSRKTVAPSHTQSHTHWLSHWIVQRPCRPCVLTPNASFYEMYRSKSCDIPKLDLSKKSKPKKFR